MKSIYFFIALGLSAGSSYAAQSPYRMGGSPDPESLRIGNERVLTRAGNLTGDDFTGEIITEAPAGDTRHYSGASTSIMNVFGISEVEVDGFVADITFTEDGKAYWLNPLSNAPLGSYVVGDVEGDKIRFTFPQHIHDEDYGFMVYQMFATMMDVTLDFETGDLTYAPADDQTLELTIGKDGVIRQSGNSSRLCLSDWDSTESKLFFDGYADNGYVLTPFDETAIEVPASVEFDYWLIEEDYNEYRRWLVSVGFDANDVYIKGLDPNFPDWTVKGVVDGDKVTVPSGQYLGIAYFRYNYVKNATIEYRFDDELGREVGYVVSKDGSFVFNYDADARRLTSPDRDCTLLFNEGNSIISPNRVIVNPTIASQGEITDLTPFPAYNLKGEYLESNNQVGLRFTSPCQNMEKQLLPSVDCSYEIFIDDELFTFRKNDYPRLSEDMTEVPYTFSDNFDIQYIPGTDYHYVYFYFNNMKKIGVRMVYTDPATGEKHYSETATLNVNFSGIDSVESNESAEVEYYNLQGMRVAAPADGMFIRRQGNESRMVIVK